jgi:hypothetical protein
MASPPLATETSPPSWGLIPHSRLSVECEARDDCIAARTTWSWRFRDVRVPVGSLTFKESVPVHDARVNLAVALSGKRQKSLNPARRRREEKASTYGVGNLETGSNERIALPNRGTKQFAFSEPP